MIVEVDILSMVKSLILIVANAAGVYLATLYITGISFTDGILAILGVGVILSAANAVIKPLIRLVTLPLIWITLGLFSFIINAAILYAVDFLVPQLVISGVVALLFGSILVTVVNFLARRLFFFL